MNSPAEDDHPRHGLKRQSDPWRLQEGATYNGHFGCTCYHPLFRSTSSAIWSEEPATSIALTVGVTFWNPSSSIPGTQPVPLFPRGRRLRLTGHLRSAPRVSLRDPPTNLVLQQSIGHLLTRPIGRPPNHVRRYYASFSYQAGSWEESGAWWPRWNGTPATWFPVSVSSSPTCRGRLSGWWPITVGQRNRTSRKVRTPSNGPGWRKFRNNEIRLQLHARLQSGTFVRTLALPKEVEHC